MLKLVLNSFKAYDVTPNAEQIDELLQWRDEEGVDFWRAASAGYQSTVMIPPYLQDDFENFLKSSGVEFKVKIEDVGEVEKEFEADRIRRLEAKKIKPAFEPFATPSFDVYWSSNEMDTYSRFLASNYPHVVTREVIARSFEGRDVYALKISRGGFGNKPVIFMDGGMHAREWVSQASVMYLLHRMIEDTVTSIELLNNVDWIIIPNLNPDGYNWAFTQDRMWRKNRNALNSTCLGVDLNRNFRFSWTAPRVLTVIILNSFANKFLLH